MMEIGATCVGSIHTTFAPGSVEKGREKGYFSFGGSCVATLFQPKRVCFDDELLVHASISREVYAKMGESCGRAIEQ